MITNEGAGGIIAQVDGRKARVMDYAPGQQLQPHRHDIDELFEIRGL